MADQLQLEVVTPERRVLSESVNAVTVPGRGGEMGILPGHAPMISELQTGVLSYNEGSALGADKPNGTRSYAGFVALSETNCR